MVARCLNCTGHPQSLRVGSTIGTFTTVEADQEQDQLMEAANTVSRIHESYPHRGSILEHVRPIFDAAKGSFHGPYETRKLAELLTRYSSVFSTGNRDAGRTTLMEHSISLTQGARPIRLPTPPLPSPID